MVCRPDEEQEEPAEVSTLRDYTLRHNPQADTVAKNLPEVNLRA